MFLLIWLEFRLELERNKLEYEDVVGRIILNWVLGWALVNSAVKLRESSSARFSRSILLHAVRYKEALCSGKCL